MNFLKNPNLRFAAAACFAVPAVLQLIYMLQYAFSFWPFVAMVGYILAAVGLCKPLRIVSVVGCGLAAATGVNTIIALMGFSLGANMVASSLLTVIIWGLVACALLMPKRALLMGSVACGAGLVLIVLDLSTGFAVQSTLRYLSCTAGAFLCGCYLFYEAQRTAPTGLKPGADELTGADKLRKLQTQLENGEITQQEYDVQEKRLLGL